MWGTDIELLSFAKLMCSPTPLKVVNGTCMGHTMVHDKCLRNPLGGRAIYLLHLHEPYHYVVVLETEEVNVKRRQSRQS